MVLMKRMKGLMKKVRGLKMSKKLIIVLGPTAVGKTSYAISLANQINSPVINCDSRQIYKELNIGVARPSDQELSQAKHYFIATRSITDLYTAGQFELDALELLQELFKTHSTLVMCGGSGLYIDALCNGIDPFPPADMSLREKLNAQMEKEGIESLRYTLKRIDPESYDTIDIANPQRVIRAIEVTLQTGRKFSDWKSGSSSASSLAGKTRDFEIEKIGLNRPREVLYQRIEQRVDKMMEDGLLEEVKSLDKFRYVNGELHSDLAHIPALRTVGYRELFDYLDGKCSLDEAVEQIKLSTRHYAKRQLTWWGRDKSIEWKMLQ